MSIEENQREFEYYSNLLYQNFDPQNPEDLNKAWTRIADSDDFFGCNPKKSVICKPELYSRANQLMESEVFRFFAYANVEFPKLWKDLYFNIDIGSFPEDFTFNLPTNPNAVTNTDIQTFAEKRAYINRTDWPANYSDIEFFTDHTPSDESVFASVLFEDGWHAQIDDFSLVTALMVISTATANISGFRHAQRELELKFNSVQFSISMGFEVYFAFLRLL